jgi:hypothetical protein
VRDDAGSRGQFRFRNAPLLCSSRNHHCARACSNVPHLGIVLGNCGASAFDLSTGAACSLRVSRIQIGHFDSHLTPINIEFLGNQHGQSVLDALAGFGILVDDVEGVVRIYLDVEVRIERRGSTAAALAATRSLCDGFRHHETDHDAAAGQGGHLQEGSTIHLRCFFGFLDGAHYFLPPFAAR